MKKNQPKTDTKKHEEELLSLKSQLARALADYQNLEKRVAAAKEGWMKFAAADIIQKLLPVLDTLKVARASDVGGESLDLVVKQFESALSEVGVTPIKTAGEVFDPVKMDCVEVVAGEPDGQVMAEIAPGYYYHDHVLRPAKVKVYKAGN